MRKLFPTADSRQPTAESREPTADGRRPKPLQPKPLAPPIHGLPLAILVGGGTTTMWNLIKRIFFFRVGQSASRSMARTVGLGRFAVLAGLIGGWRYMRRN